MCATLCVRKPTCKSCATISLNSTTSSSCSYHQCRCVSPLQWLARFVALPGNSTIIEAPLCEFNDTCPLWAGSRLSENESILTEFCSDCKEACSSVDFVVTPSSVVAPSSLVANITREFVERQGVPLPVNWTTNWRAEVRNNYVGLDVVCQSRLVENYTTEPSMSAIDVISNVGGQTGLWIGISFLSVMELIEMLYRLVRHQFLRMIGRGTRNTSENN